jgi:hypothetical protein
MDLARALDDLTTAQGDQEPSGQLRPAAEALARAIVEAAGDGSKAEIAGTSYAVREVTWPVKPEDGGSSFPCPHPTLTLLRDDAVLLDIRADYWDGNTNYRVVGDKIGKWSRFRMGSPGDRGYDLHLADDREVVAFAGEAAELLGALGLI